ncbi:hypothetical protein RB213_003379 [Colletotrichum asianum]
MPDQFSKERRAGWLAGTDQAGLRFEVRGVDVDADVRACPCRKLACLILLPCFPLLCRASDGMADTATWNEIDSNKGKKIKAARH